MTRTQPPGRSGFTLIELLVVIGIIAVLAAIFFPVFASAREKARQTQCLSNLRQMGMASFQYAEDYDEALVPWRVRDNSPRYQSVWCGLIQPYLKNGLNASAPGQVQSVEPLGVFKCPSFNEATLGRTMDAPDCDGGGSQYVHNPQFAFADYGIAQPFGPAGSGTPSDPYSNYAGAGPTPDGTGFADVRLSMVAAPRGDDHGQRRLDRLAAGDARLPAAVRL